MHYRKLTEKELIGFFADYRCAFPDWTVEHDVVLVRSNGPLVQSIAFEALRTGAYRPMCVVEVVPAGFQVLVALLSVRFREVRPREHSRKLPLVLRAIEEEFEPPVRGPLEVDDVLRRAERDVRACSVSNPNMLAGVAALNALSGNSRRAVELCGSIASALSQEREPADWHRKTAAFATALAAAIHEGRAREYLGF